MRGGRIKRANVLPRYYFALLLRKKYHHEMEKILLELKKLEQTIGREAKKTPHHLLAMHKIAAYMRGTEKPKRETLNRLALLAGFQDWDDFSRALHGAANGQANYNEE